MTDVLIVVEHVLVIVRAIAARLGFRSVLSSYRQPISHDFARDDSFFSRSNSVDVARWCRHF